MVAILALLAVIAVGSAVTAALAQPVVAAAGEVAGATAEVAKATADAIVSESNMLIPVMKDRSGISFTPKNIDSIPSDAVYDPIGAFRKLISVPAHQAAFIGIATKLFNDIAKAKIEQQGKVAQALALSGQDVKTVNILLSESKDALLMKNLLQLPKGIGN